MRCNLALIFLFVVCANVQAAKVCYYYYEYRMAGTIGESLESNQTCPDDGNIYVCIEYIYNTTTKMTANSEEEKGYLHAGMCQNYEYCPTFCDYTEPAEEVIKEDLGAHEATITHCTSKCCYDDYCNKRGSANSLLLSETILMTSLASFLYLFL